MLRWRGDRVQAQRKRLGLSQAKTAKMIGKDAPFMSKVERGKLPVYPGWARLLAVVFGVPETELVEEVEMDAAQS